jgi:hypothetical protein
MAELQVSQVGRFRIAAHARDRCGRLIANIASDDGLILPHSANPKDRIFGNDNQAHIRSIKQTHLDIAGECQP